MSSGSIGVTIFFVLSGFLITRVLVESREAGRWSLRDFYVARAVRLVPALVLMVGTVSAAMLALGRAPNFVALRAIPAVLYVQNYVPRLDYAIFQHTWSLAVEEQFYLLWPLALPFLLRSRRRWFWLAGVILVSAALWTQIDTGALPMHAYGLLVGCTLALVAPNLATPTRSLAVAGWLGTCGVLMLVEVMSSESPWPRLAALPFAVALVWAATAGTGMLTVRPLRFVGRISYAFYLWHFPLIPLVYASRGSLDAVAAVGVSGMIATASTLWLEEPVRRAWRQWSRSVGAVEPLQQQPDQPLVLPGQALGRPV
jgi:peptidoglycan/LPS O-acetylase OafA/YrhL